MRFGQSLELRKLKLTMNKKQTELSQIELDDLKALRDMAEESNKSKK